MTSKHTDPNTFPSLFARLTPASVDGAQGFSVACTATRRDLGVVFWTCASVVTWHWRTTSGQTGECTTKRNAVQALRDRQNESMGARLPFTPDVAPIVVRAPRVVVAPATEVPVAARRIVWGDESQTPDITAAIAAAFARIEVKK
jgi:hypothetical protein